jgi:RsiW-degrading membrane proteinase PrsW (M82 family)
VDRHCPNCGAEVPEDASFCPVCGKPLSREAPQPEQVTPQPVPPATASTAKPGSLPAGPARNNDKMIRWALGIAVVLFMCLVGLVSLALSFMSLGIALFVGMVMALLPLPLYLALALWIDRYEKEPIWMLAGAFLWGATVAILFSGIVNSINASIFGQLFGMVVSAPVVEESSKGLALFILFFWKRNEFDGVVDGILYAAMVALGFATVENFDYYGRFFLEGGAGGALLTFAVRGVVGPFAHPLFTSMTGIGLGLARQSNKTYVKFLAPVVGLLAAMALHALWNASGVPAGLVSFFGIYLLVMVPAFIGVLVLIFYQLRREGSIVRRYLTPELQSGLLTQQEYDSLSSVRKRLASSYKALSAGGFGGWRANSRFSQVATELAFLRDRVRRGITSPDDAEREAAYVRVMRDLKGQLSAGRQQVAGAG